MKKQNFSVWLHLFKKGEVLFLLSIFLFFLILLRESFSYPSDSRSFPELIILCTLILSGILLLVTFFIPALRNVMISPEPKGVERFSKEWRKGRFYWGWLSIIIALLSAFLFGFIFLIPASFISYTLLLGRRSMFLKALALSAMTAIVLYVLFDHFLGIPMMRGVLWRDKIF